MELTDKTEPPVFATCESYGIAISFACLSDFVLSLVQIDHNVMEGQIEGMTKLKRMRIAHHPLAPLIKFKYFILLFQMLKY